MNRRNGSIDLLNVVEKRRKSGRLWVLNEEYLSSVACDDAFFSLYDLTI